MKLFRIIFEHNEPKLAIEVDFTHHVGIETTCENGKKITKSITIFAKDEQDAIATASDIASDSMNACRAARA